ncbi:MAG: pseudouridine synthase [Gemmatimonadota bacterium]|nr:pseudouridine synthase [Gemmatimonadota bacterium]
MSDGMRIQKFLSRAGKASRREAERLMQEGRVRVNGEVVTELGTRVDADRDAVELDGERVTQEAKRWVAFHKPPGVLTTRSDPHGGTTVYDVLPEALASLNYVGRLDRDAEGLLLMTNDGDLANRVQHPSGEVEREYWVEAAGVVDAGVVRRLTSGVRLEDGTARARRVRVLDAGPTVSHLRLVLTEGRKREVRRMMSEVGHGVLRLKRLRFGPVRLDELPRGEWRSLTPRELDGLRKVRARPRRSRGKGRADR